MARWWFPSHSFMVPGSSYWVASYCVVHISWWGFLSSLVSYHLAKHAVDGLSKLNCPMLCVNVCVTMNWHPIQDVSPVVKDYVNKLQSGSFNSILFAYMLCETFSNHVSFNAYFPLANVQCLVICCFLGLTCKNIKKNYLRWIIAKLYEHKVPVSDWTHEEGVEKKRNRSYFKVYHLSYKTSLHENRSLCIQSVQKNVTILFWTEKTGSQNNSNELVFLLV